MNSARLVPATSAALDWEISPLGYQSNAAATRISLTNSDGDKRRADSAPWGTSNVTVGMMASPPSAGALLRVPVRHGSHLPALCSSSHKADGRPFVRWRWALL